MPYITKLGSKLMLTQSFYSVVLYANNLTLFFIYINENIGNFRKIAEELGGIPTNLLISQLTIGLNYQTWF